jgi:hypothetical protein
MLEHSYTTYLSKGVCRTCLFALYRMFRPYLDYHLVPLCDPATLLILAGAAEILRVSSGRRNSTGPCVPPSGGAFSID